MSNSRWINLGAAYVALVAGFLPYVGWSPSLDAISEDLGLSYAQAGTISSVTGFVAGATILVGGLLATRLGSKLVVLVGLAAGVAGQLMFSMADSFEWVIAGRVLAGLAVGFLWVATYTMAVDWFRDSKQTDRALGVMLSGDGVGALLSLFAFSALLAALGWRTGLTVQAIVLLAVFVLVLAVSKNAPSSGVDSDPVQTDVVTPTPLTTAHRSIRSVMNRNVLSGLIFWIGGVGVFSVIASWMPAILVEEGGLSQSLAGLLASLFSIAGMGGALAAPLLATRLKSNKRVILLSGIAMTIAVAAMTLFVATGDWVLLAITIPLIGVSQYTGQTLALAEAVDSVDPHYAGVVNGLILGVPWLVSGFAYPYVIGLVKDSTGSFVGGFVAVAVATLVLCAISPLFIKEVAPATTESPEVLDSRL